MAQLQLLTRMFGLSYEQEQGLSHEREKWESELAKRTEKRKVLEEELEREKAEHKRLKAMPKAAGIPNEFLLTKINRVLEANGHGRPPDPWNEVAKMFLEAALR